MTTKRLWIAEARVDIAVWAETEEEARELANEALPDEAANCSVSRTMLTPTTIEQVPMEWRNALVYGGKGILTCADVMAGRDVCGYCHCRRATGADPFGGADVCAKCHDDLKQRMDAVKALGGDR